MKTGIVLTLTILLLTLYVSSVPAQEDTIININDVNCSIIRTSLIRDLNTDKVNYKSYTLDLENLKSLAFIRNNSIAITSGMDSSYRLNINDLKELNRLKGNHIVPGIILGTIVGGLSGFAIGSSGPYMTPANKNLSALLGACAGALVGYIIGSLAVDYETLNLFGLPDKNKRSEIIQFLKQKK